MWIQPNCEVGGGRREEERALTRFALQERSGVLGAREGSPAPLATEPPARGPSL